MSKISLIEQIKLDECFKSKPYRCSADKLTIGYGRNIEDNGISKVEANILLQNDIMDAKREAVSIMQINQIGYNREVYDILTQMLFQMGRSRVDKFVKMLDALSVADYKTAAREMLNSKWHTDTPARCERLAKEMDGIV